MSSETEYVMTLFIFSLKWFIPEACALHLINQHMSLHFTLKSLHHNYVVFSDSSFLIIFTRWSISCFFKRANTLKPVFQTYIFLHTQKMCRSFKWKMSSYHNGSWAKMHKVISNKQNDANPWITSKARNNFIHVPLLSFISDDQKSAYICMFVFLPSLIGIIRLIVMVSLRWKVLTQSVNPVAQSTVEVSSLWWRFQTLSQWSSKCCNWQFIPWLKLPY